MAVVVRRAVAADLSAWLRLFDPSSPLASPAGSMTVSAALPPWVAASLRLRPSRRSHRTMPRRATSRRSISKASWWRATSRDAASDGTCWRPPPQKRAVPAARGCGSTVGRRRRRLDQLLRVVRLHAERNSARRLLAGSAAHM